MPHFDWLSEDQINRIRPYFLRFCGEFRVDDRRAFSGIIHVPNLGLQ